MLEKLAGMCAWSLLGVPLVGLFLVLPPRRANPDLARSATTVRLLREVGDKAQIRASSYASVSANRGLISLDATESQEVEVEGYTALRKSETRYRVLTRSDCLELEDGCVTILDKKVDTAISVKVPF